MWMIQIANKVKWNMLVKQTWETYTFKLYQNAGHAIAIMSKDVLKHSMKSIIMGVILNQTQHYYVGLDRLV
jgi:hypothetical protein